MGRPQLGRRDVARLYQCPGCWSWGLFMVPPDEGSLECGCGQRLDCVDLRGERAGDSAVWDALHGRIGLRVPHGRHCPCSACFRQDWADPALAPCGLHGAACLPVHQPGERRWPDGCRTGIEASTSDHEELDRAAARYREAAARG